MTDDYVPGRPDAALFIDWDNLKAGIRSMGRQPNLSSLMDAVRDRGRIVVARAYADWQQRTNLFDPPNLYAAGIEPVYVPVKSQGGRILKNSADVKLAVDCIDFLNSAPHLKMFMLVSGDADLVHLVNFLRARGKRVVVIAVSNSLSAALSENVDEVLIYDVDIDPVRVPEPPAPSRKSKPAPEPKRLQEAFDALADMLRRRSDRVGSLFSWIGIQLSRQGFDHRALGFERFKDFMQEAERQGRVRIVTRGLQDWAYLPEQYEQLTESEAQAEEEEETQSDESEVASNVTVGALDEEDRHNFIRYLIDLEKRSDYLIPPYIVSHLVRGNVLPSLSQSQLRALVRDAGTEEILVPSTHTVPHKTTGKPHELRTLRVNEQHPLVEEVVSQEAA